MPIRILPPEVAVRIAAGEVIERPASVVKELLENAIDAGATAIEMEIAQGGRRLIGVTDDGCGIPADEVEMAFARHATSKLDSAEDLFHVRTLGFRGEALASIAAVARVTLATRTAEAQVGALVRLEGGQLVEHEPIARPRGTTVQVEHLFFNTPARLKFLRADPTEAAHIARLVSSYGLAYPGLRLTLTSNGRLMLRTLGTGALADAITAVLGLDVAEGMIALPPPPEDAPIAVTGAISAPSLQRANRRDMFLFVNRRWVQDNALTYAIGEAYRTLLPQGRYPVVILSIALPPEEVDVNVHPTKQEVRFRRQGDVFAAVQRAVRTTLMAQFAAPSVRLPGETTAAQWRSGALGGAITPEQARLAIELQRPGDVTRLASPVGEAPPAPGRLPMLRVVGQVAQTYIVAEGPGGLYLIDQHAAHERIRYEALQALGGHTPASQELLDPLPVELSPQHAALLEAHLAELVEFGLELLPFGGNTLIAKRLPVGMEPAALPLALAEMLDAAAEGGAAFQWREQALFSLACHSAVRAGQTLSHEEMRDLVRQLERTALPHTCPHGRPTLIHLTQEALERQFGRR